MSLTVFSAFKARKDVGRGHSVVRSENLIKVLCVPLCNCSQSVLVHFVAVLLDGFAVLTDS